MRKKRHKSAKEIAEYNPASEDTVVVVNCPFVRWEFTPHRLDRERQDTSVQRFSRYARIAWAEKSGGGAK